jgi:scyllo-inositol 2-dehydrogenase (NADP+)
VDPSAALRVGLVGYGLGGSVFHAPFIAADRRLDLSVVVTSDPGRQEAARASYPNARIMSSFGELLDSLDDIHVVVVSTPNATHASLAEQVIRHGRDVVIDKPVAPSAADVRRLMNLAADTDRLIVPFQNRRWDSDFRTVQALLRSGRLGPLHRFESRYERWQPTIDGNATRSWKRDPTPGVATGILYDLGSHIIDQAVVLFGRPDSVYAEIDIRRPQAAVADDVFVALLYPGGLHVHLWTSAVAADRGPRFRLLGLEGSYVKYGMDIQENALMKGESPSDPEWGEEPEQSWGALTTAAGTEPEPSLPGAYQLFYSGLAACLLDGGPTPVDVNDVVVSAEIIDAAQVSARVRQTVRI